MTGVLKYEEMANKSRFEVVLPQILKLLNERRKGVYSFAEIKDIFLENKDRWRLPLYMDLDVFIDKLTTMTTMKQKNIEFTNVPVRRVFAAGDVPIYDVAVNLFSKAYLSHLSASKLLGLINDESSLIYLTNEQSSKVNSTSKLIQSNIDAAFKKQPRVSEERADYDGYQIVLLRGKNTGNLGIENAGDRNRPILMTGLERTLIDIAVRPFYSGGIEKVIEAYRAAGKSRDVSTSKMLDYLNKLNYIYPYHQAIGFYLEAAGTYTSSQLNVFRKQDKEYRFYLDYAMGETEYSKEWRVFYPKGILV